MANLMYDLKLYFILITARIRCQMQYRLSLVMDLVGFFCVTFIEFVTVLIIFTHIQTLGGWSLGEVALLSGTSSIAFAITEIVGGGFDYFYLLIRDGKFDGLLVRPVGEFTQVLASEFVLRRFGRLIQGVLIVILGLRWLELALTPWQCLVLLGGVICGVLIYLALFICQSVCCFWTIQSLEVFNVLTYGSSEATSYPMEIYSSWLRRFLTFVLPVVFINYIPVSLVLAKEGVLGLLSPWVGYLPPLVGLAIYWMSRKLWDWGVNQYQSTGN